MSGSSFGITSGAVLVTRTVKLVPAAARHHGIDAGGRTDIVARLEIGSRRGEPIELPDLAPAVFPGEASAHAALYSMRF